MKSTFGRWGLLKSRQNEQGVEGILTQTFLKVFTHHEIIYRIPMSAHNENCGFMRTYIPCYMGSEPMVSLTKNDSKTRLNKRNTYLSKMFFIISFISIFPLLYVRCCPT